MKKFFLLAIVFSLLLSSCSIPFTSQAAPTPIPLAALLDNPAPTLTPFQPMAPTPTVAPTTQPTPKPTNVVVSAPTPTSYIPSYVVPDDQVRILILGSDYRPGRGFRTDVIMLLVLNPKAGSATITSFPRDLYVTIPGVGMERINTAQAYGGFPLMAATFQQNFGVTPDYYMMTNFEGFKSIVNTLGGINVTTFTSLYDECNSAVPIRDGMGYCTVKPGTTVMDGETALWYVRSRHTTSDFDRTRREQEVLTGLFQKLISLNALNRAPELYDSFKSSVETDIPLGEIAGLLPLAGSLATNPGKLRTYAVGSGETYNYIVPGSGAMVLIPDTYLVSQIIQQAISQ
jgi:LCP family protein required for cell wall assembly